MKSLINSLAVAGLVAGLTASVAQADHHEKKVECKADDKACLAKQAADHKCGADKKAEAKCGADKKGEHKCSAAAKPATEEKKK